MAELKWKFFMSEYDRDDMLRNAINTQSLEVDSLRVRMSRQAETLQKNLKTVHGNIEDRLDRLTRAFLSYVHLDDLEKQLRAFVGHPETRSHALRSIQRLATGLTPDTTYPDTPRYWLVPAVAALHPDGHLDETLAEQARQRNPEATRIFLTIALGALGRGATVAHELPALLQPDGEGHWTRWQVLVWQAVVLGAYGPDALSIVGGIVDAVLDTEQDWEEWASRQATETARSSRNRSTEEFKSLRWVLDQFENATALDLTRPGVDPLRTAGPDFTPSGPPLKAVDGEERTDKPEPGKVTPTFDPREAAGTMLLEALTLRVVGSSDEEDELLAEASRSRQEFMQLLVPETISSDSSHATTPALVAVQRMVTAPELPLTSQAWLWRRVLPHFAALAEQCVVTGPPAPPELPIRQVKDVLVGPDGVLQPSKLRAARSRIEAQAPQGLITRKLPVTAVGIVTGVVAFALMARSMMWPG